jgi:8-oxo-dGTP diphosphatase
MANKSYDIYKAAGIVIQDRKVISTRSKESNIFITPGGKLEEGETEIQALIRELREELSIDVDRHDVEKIADYYAPAAGKTGKTIRMATYLVSQYTGTISANGEIEEVRSFNSSLPNDIEIAPLLSEKIIPLLHQQGLID